MLGAVHGVHISMWQEYVAPQCVRGVLPYNIYYSTVKYINLLEEAQQSSL